MALLVNLKFFVFCLFLVFLSVKLESVQAANAHTTPSFNPNWDDQKKKDYNFFNYIARGFDIKDANLDDFTKDSSTWKKPVWVMDTSNGSTPKPDGSGNAYIPVPKFISLDYPSDISQLTVTSAIYNTLDDLLPLLYHTKVENNGFLLRHSIENFENRFRETTLAKESVVNGLATISVTQVEAINTMDQGYFHADFVQSITKLLQTITNPKILENYKQFIQDYGTHFVLKTGFGGILMLNAKIATNNSALGSPKFQKTLENDIGKHLTYLATQKDSNPTEALESNQLHYKHLYFGGDPKPQSEDKFFRTILKNRTISKIKLVPFSYLFENDCFRIQKAIGSIDKTACKNVLTGLKTIEDIHEFKYGLKRYLAAYEVAKKSPFHLTALGYQNVDNARIYITTYLDKQFPSLDDKWRKYLSQVIRWPLEYQIGLRGSLSYNH